MIVSLIATLCHDRAFRAVRLAQSTSPLTRSASALSASLPTGLSWSVRVIKGREQDTGFVDILQRLADAPQADASPG